MLHHIVSEKVVRIQQQQQQQKKNNNKETNQKTEFSINSSVYLENHDRFMDTAV
jgi:hypothetical protein